MSYRRWEERKIYKRERKDSRYIMKIMLGTTMYVNNNMQKDDVYLSWVSCRWPNIHNPPPILSILQSRIFITATCPEYPARRPNIHTLHLSGVSWQRPNIKIGYLLRIYYCTGDEFSIPWMYVASSAAYPDLVGAWILSRSGSWSGSEPSFPWETERDPDPECACSGSAALVAGRSQLFGEGNRSPNLVTII